jgi:quercetin dioxygenase-like cupin family protein
MTGILSDMGPILVAACAIAIGSVALVQAQAKTKTVVWTASELKWVDSATMKGAQQAVLWGDPNKGAYGVLKKVTPGTVLPMHWHSHATRVVIVSGTITFALDGSAPKDMPPQSYASIPGGVKHMATCAGTTDCVYFETADAAYDIKLVAPPR